MRLFQPSPFKNPSELTAGRFFFAKVVETSAGASDQTLGKVVFNTLGDPSDISRGEAYPLLPYIKSIPLVDEVVLCLIGPSSQQETTSKSTVAYYISGVNIWNHPQHTAYTREKDAPILHPDFKESADINPMIAYPGDILLEGRRGQSIRFSETQTNTTWKGPENQKPLIIVSNGQVATEEGFTPTAEDINRDSSSIYLTSNQSIPLTQPQTFRLFDSPTTANYSDSQVIINGDRLVFSSKKDSILLQATSAVGIKGVATYIEATDKVEVEAPKVLLGKSANEKAVLGNKLVDELRELYSELSTLAVQVGLMGSAIGNLEAVRLSADIKVKLDTRRVGLSNKILSDKVYVSK